VWRNHIGKQVRDIQRRRGLLIDRTERIANSLGKLAGVVGTLNAHLHTGKVGNATDRLSEDAIWISIPRLSRDYLTN